MTTEEMFELHRLRAEKVQLRAAVSRAKTVLENMAEKSHEPWPWSRWAIHHEPLRVDAENLLPILNAALGGENE